MSMSYAGGLLFALICLALITGGIVLLIHGRGTRDHGPDCRTCSVFNRLLRIR